MALRTFHIKRGDRLPALSATLETAAGTAVDLTGGTVKFLMRRGSAPATVDAAATIVDGPAGSVRYEWAAGETDMAGTYDAEFELTTGGKKYTFPNDGHFAVIVRPDLS